MRIYFTALEGNNYYNPHFPDQETEKNVDVKYPAQNHIFSKWYVWIWNPRILHKKPNTSEKYMEFLEIESFGTQKMSLYKSSLGVSFIFTLPIAKCFTCSSYCFKIVDE